MALLEIRNIVRRFGDFTAVDGVSMSIESGEFFTLLGPSGCGKTTLLRMIAGFDTPQEGEILLDGRDLVSVPPEKRPIHTVFQSYALFPHMTVAENIAFPLTMRGMGKDEIGEKVKESLEDVRLSDRGARYPDELSGGQRQRVALARALVNRPRLLLLDEPLAALDMKLREQMQIELINLQKEVGITFIYVTHDQTEALALSHRIAVMNGGRVEQLDEPSKIYDSPKNRFVADFIGTCNLVEAEVTAAGDEKMVLEIKGLGEVMAKGKAESGTKGTLALRPEKVRIGTKVSPEVEENHFRGKVHDFLYMGDVTVYIVEVGEGVHIEALLPNSAAGRPRILAAGDPVEISWRFDAGTFLHE
ncbi:MAG: spermidine/putrescine ABC transporter ATP-binding protein [Burkholderiales bacterium 21-58-4]|nr:MAG: spermidine/putrescine ABC transporter ATP-binding protein [Burkholderiales bacterium 21-58-4]HQT25222.1 ABC transporter ATP-binding protein [Burkholderiales bacterium]